MNLQERIELLARLGDYLKTDEDELLMAKENATRANPWFTPEFIDLSLQNIRTRFLQSALLNQWVQPYHIPEERKEQKTVGIVMAGNIPLVGFHDLLCVFISGHHAVVKLSSKDDVLIKHMVQKMYGWDNRIQNDISFAENLKGCDAYIATGSNNSGRYFEYYFGKYPNIIRRNRTSVAVLDGTETSDELALLSNDIHQYFGFGCRNITKLYVPEGYDFVPLLESFKRYDYFTDFHKYKNNYDYNLALLMLNNKYYMSSQSVILSEDESIFSPASVLHYGFYADKDATLKILGEDDNIQCITAHGNTSFGAAQSPGLSDYADGVDTMNFLCTL